ncbi:MAG: hypothetical protein NT155_03285 [Candidatus Staskawiczbacteria bacterium]|nr:hypothetical protein [Candidatus Staskawiczbacteria bacterium]
MNDLGNVGIGTAAPTGKFNIVSDDAIDSDPISYIDRYAGANVAAISSMVYRKARGTKSTPTALQSGDSIGGLAFRGYGATGFPSASTALISSVAEQTFTDSAMGTALAFKTTPLNSITSTEVMRINNAGFVGIGTASPTNILSLGGQSAQTFWMERETTAATAGNNLTITAGGAKSGGTDLAGGNLILTSGVATGAGTSQITFNTYPAGSTGTADATVTTALQIMGDGTVKASNSKWFASVDNAGTGVINMFRDNASDQIELGATLVSGPIEAVADAGNVSIFDEPLTLATGNGTAVSASLRLAETNILSISGISDGNGGITSPYVGIGTTTPGAMLDIGLAGTTLGTMRLEGNTSGYVQLQSAAAAGSWTMTLPAAVGGGAGYLLTDVAGNGITSWTAPASSRDLKDIAGTVTDPTEALTQILGTPIYRFHYKPGMGTGDTATEYVGVMADEAPWAMHYNGAIINPVNTLGYMVLGVQALSKEIADLKTQINSGAGTVGDGTINGLDLSSPFVKEIKNILALLGIKTNKGSVEKIQMVDQATGDIYCTWIANGDWQKQKGACDEISNSQLPISNESGGTSDIPPTESAPTPDVVETPPITVIETPAETTPAPEIVPPSPEITVPPADVVAPPPAETPVPASDATPPGADSQ